MANPEFNLETTNAVLLSDALKAIVSFMDTDAYGEFLYLAALIGFVMLLVNWISGGGRKEVAGYALAVFIGAFGIHTKSTLLLTDRAGGHFRDVQDVPLILSLPFWLIGTVSKALVDLSSLTLTVPSNVDLKDGVGYGTALIASMQNARWVDADIPTGITDANKKQVSLTAAITTYMNDCYIPYINSYNSGLQATTILYDPTTKVSTPAEAWDLFKVDIVLWSPNFTAAYDSNLDSAISTCNDYHAAIKAVVNNANWQLSVMTDLARNYQSLSGVMERPGAATSGMSASAANVAYLAKVTTDTANYIALMFGLTSSADGRIRGSTIFLMQYLGRALNASIGADGRLMMPEWQGRLGSAFQDAVKQRNLQMAAEGDFFTKYAGNMVRFIEFLVFIWLPVALFWMLATPGGIKQLKNILFLYVWIQTWPFAFNIINYFQVVTTLSEMQPLLAGGVNLTDIDNAFSGAERAFATSQMFLGMLPILTMALLTGNIMSMSKLSEKVSGAERLDEDRVWRDTECVDPASVVETKSQLSMDAQGNVVAADSKAQTALNQQVSTGLSNQASLSERRAETATKAASADFNKLLASNNSADTSRAIINSAGDSVQIKEDAGVQIAQSTSKDVREVSEKLEQVMSQVKGSVSGSANWDKGKFLKAAAGLDAGLSSSDSEAIRTAMGKAGLTQEQVTSALGQTDSFTVTDSTSINASELTGEQKTLAQRVNSQSAIASSEEQAANRMRSTAKEIRSGRKIITSRAADVAAGYYADISKIDEKFKNSDPQNVNLTESEQRTFKAITGSDFKDKDGKVNTAAVENASGYISSTLNELRGESGQTLNDRITTLHSGELGAQGINERDHRNLLRMQYVDKSGALNQLIAMDSGYGFYNNLDIDEENKNNVNEVEEFKPTLVDNPNLSPAAITALEQEVAGAVPSDTPGLSAEDEEKIRVLRQKQKAAERKGRKIAGKGDKAVAGAEVAFTTDDQNGGVGVLKHFDSGSEYLQASKPNQFLDGTASRYTAGQGGLSDPDLEVGEEYEERVERVLGAAYPEYHQQIAANGGTSQSGDAAFIGKLTELLGPDENKRFNSGIQRLANQNGGNINSIPQNDFDKYIATYSNKLNDIGVPTDLETVRQVSNGLDENKQNGVLSRISNFLSLSSPQVAQQAKNEDLAEVTTEGIVASNTTAEAQYNSVDTFRGSLASILQQRGGNVVSPMDMTMAKLVTLQDFATADGQGGEYEEWLEDLADKLYNPATGTLNGNAQDVNAQLQSAGFQKYADQLPSDFHAEFERLTEVNNQAAHYAGVDSGLAISELNDRTPKPVERLTGQNENFTSRFEQLLQNAEQDASAFGREVTTDDRRLAELEAYREFANVDGTQSNYDEALKEALDSYDYASGQFKDDFDVDQFLRDNGAAEYRHHVEQTYSNVGSGALPNQFNERERPDIRKELGV